MGKGGREEAEQDEKDEERVGRGDTGKRRRSEEEEQEEDDGWDCRCKGTLSGWGDATQTVLTPAARAVQAVMRTLEGRGYLQVRGSSTLET